MNFYQRMGKLPLKKRVNRDKWSFATKQRLFGVFAIDEILRYRWAPLAGLRTLCHPDCSPYIVISTEEICTTCKNPDQPTRDEDDNCCKCIWFHFLSHKLNYWHVWMKTYFKPSTPEMGWPTRYEDDIGGRVSIKYQYKADVGKNTIASIVPNTKTVIISSMAAISRK